jgi:hypothetical protein
MLWCTAEQQSKNTALPDDPSTCVHGNLATVRVTPAALSCSLLLQADMQLKEVTTAAHSAVTYLTLFLAHPAVAGTELLDEAFHYGCRDPATGQVEWADVDSKDEFGCGARDCPAEFSECYVSAQLGRISAPR